MSALHLWGPKVRWDVLMKATESFIHFHLLIFMWKQARSRRWIDQFYYLHMRSCKIKMMDSQVFRFLRLYFYIWNFVAGYKNHMFWARIVIFCIYSFEWKLFRCKSWKQKSFMLILKYDGIYQKRLFWQDWNWSPGIAVRAITQPACAATTLRLQKHWCGPRSTAGAQDTHAAGFQWPWQTTLVNVGPTSWPGSQFQFWFVRSRLSIVQHQSLQSTKKRIRPYLTMTNASGMHL